MTQTKKFSSLLALIMAVMLALTVALSGCGKAEVPKQEAGQTEATQKEEKKEESKPEAKKDDKAEQVNMVLASTTSTQDSGLFDVLIPAFEKANPGIHVQVVAVGTGEAIKKGEQKDADCLLVHAKASEEKFVEEGYGTERRDVMYNDFIIVGPKDDPAGLAGSANAAEAFKRIAESGKEFYSRGDDSGTNKKELKIWKEAGVPNEGDWYKVTGQGMGDTLKVTDEKQGYTFTDRATYLSMEKEGAIELAIVFEGADDLLNQYGVIPVTDAKELDAANKFADWICGPEGQAIIKEYGKEKYGQPLFFPNAK